MERPNWAALQDMMGDIERTIDNLDGIQQRMMKVTGEAWSEDRMIRAVVGPRGQLVDLEIDPRVYRKPNSRALAAAIVGAVRLAVAEAGRKTQEIIDESLPSDMRRGRVGGVDLGRLIHTHDAELMKGARDDE